MGDTWNHRILKAINTGAKTIPQIAKVAGCHDAYVGVAMTQLQKLRWLMKVNGELIVTKDGAEAIGAEPAPEPPKPAAPKAMPAAPPIRPAIMAEAPAKKRGPGRPRKYKSE